MNFLQELFFGAPGSFSGGVAHSVMILSLVIGTGYILGKIRVAGISLGVTWILFVGIFFGHFSVTLDANLLSFIKEFGLILFVYSIGLQVGPRFFAAFKAGGLKLNLIAVGSIFLSVLIAVVLHLVSGLPITTMVGILCGAITNTPGMGAAQQAYTDATGAAAPDTAMGYAVAYPLGVIGVILVILLLRVIHRIDPKKEEAAARDAGSQDGQVETLTVEVTEENADGKTIRQIRPKNAPNFVISRILRREGGEVELVRDDTVLHNGDQILIIASSADLPAIAALFGKPGKLDLKTQAKGNLVSRQILITKNELHGKSLGHLNLQGNFDVSVTRVNRAGVDLVAENSLHLQIGDRLTIVGSEDAIRQAEKILGNSIKRLNHPNLIPVFIGIVLGCILGSIPIPIPGIPYPVKLGLAGGPLIVSILISRFGPDCRLVTYTTESANLMLREVGIALFLASVGLGAGDGFVETIVNQNGFIWIAYGALITIIPWLVMGFLGKRVFGVNYYTLIGVLSGANTNPPALAFSSEQTSCDAPAVGYATVYPLAMFLRVLTAQLLVLIFL